MNSRKKEEIKYTNKSTLQDVLESENGADLLVKYQVPCLGCHFASQELDQLTLQDIADAYKIDLKDLLKDLNSLHTKRESKKICKKTKKKK